MRLITYKELRSRSRNSDFPAAHLQTSESRQFPLRRKVGNLNMWTREEIEPGCAATENSDSP